jgi:hypothetical protein
MAEQNGAGNNLAAEEAISAAQEDMSSLDGLGDASPQAPLTDRPELLIGAAVIGGLLLAGVVSRLGR